MIRVLNIFSNIEHSRILERIVEHVDRTRIDLHALFLNPPSGGPAPLATRFKAMGIPTESWVFRGKRDYLPTLFHLLRKLRADRYDVVHTNLIWADYVGIPAAWLAAVRGRVVSRWHGTIHHREHPKGLKYDRLVNRLATHMIAPGRVAFRILTEWEHVDPTKVTVLVQPVELERFRHPDAASVAALRSRYNPEGRHPVIGVIARWVDWKGVQYIIPAFEQLLAEYPNALLLLFNATGNYSDAVRAQLATIPARNYRAVAYEPMAQDLYPLFDLFVHVPVDEFVESWGVVYVEALAAGVPSIFTLSGAVTGRVEHLKHCYVVPYADADAIAAAMRTLLTNPALARSLSAQGAAVFEDDCSPERYAAGLEAIYNQA